MSDEVKKAIEWAMRDPDAGLVAPQVEPREPTPPVETWDRQSYQRMKSERAREKIPCTFCGKPFETTRAAAMHEQSKHRRYLDRLLAEINKDASSD